MRWQIRGHGLVTLRRIVFHRYFTATCQRVIVPPRFSAQDQHLYTPCLSGLVKSAPAAFVSRQSREACGNVAYGGTVNPPRDRKGGAGNPPPKSARAQALSRLRKNLKLL